MKQVETSRNSHRFNRLKSDLVYANLNYAKFPSTWLRKSYKTHPDLSPPKSMAVKSSSIFFGKEIITSFNSPDLEFLSNSPLIMQMADYKRAFCRQPNKNKCESYNVQWEARQAFLSKKRKISY